MFVFSRLHMNGKPRTRLFPSSPRLSTTFFRWSNLPQHYLIAFMALVQFSNLSLSCSRRSSFTCVSAISSFRNRNDPPPNFFHFHPLDLPSCAFPNGYISDRDAPRDPKSVHYIFYSSSTRPLAVFLISIQFLLTYTTPPVILYPFRPYFTYATSPSPFMNFTSPSCLSLTIPTIIPYFSLTFPALSCLLHLPSKSPDSRFLTSFHSSFPLPTPRNPPAHSFLTFSLNTCYIHSKSLLL